MNNYILEVIPRGPYDSLKLVVRAATEDKARSAVQLNGYTVLSVRQLPKK